MRKIGDPREFARNYYIKGIDEIIYMDAVASLYQRNGLTELVSETSSEIFVPLTVGGGIRTLNDASEMMKAGADKVALNTGAIHNPGIISQIAERFGSQAVVISVEAKKTEQKGKWEAYVDNGREKTGLDVMEWLKEAVQLGAGEILITSVDQEKTKMGFDIELTSAITNSFNVPVIASGGMGTLTHFEDLILNSDVDAVAVASVLHFDDVSIDEIKNRISLCGFPVIDHASCKFM